MSDPIQQDPIRQLVDETLALVLEINDYLALLEKASNYDYSENRIEFCYLNFLGKVREKNEHLHEQLDELLRLVRQTSSQNISLKIKLHDKGKS